MAEDVLTTVDGGDVEVERVLEDVLLFLRFFFLGADEVPVADDVDADFIVVADVSCTAEGERSVSVLLEPWTRLGALESSLGVTDETADSTIESPPRTVLRGLRKDRCVRRLKCMEAEALDSCSCKKIKLSIMTSATGVPVWEELHLVLKGVIFEFLHKNESNYTLVKAEIQ